MKRFSKVIDRKGTRSVKWDLLTHMYGDEDVLPMWVADMDFAAPEVVTAAIKERAEHGIYGYTWPDDQVKKVIQSWQESRHGWKVQPSWIQYSPGVIPSLHMIIQSLSDIGDHVLIQPPVYPPFYSVIEEHGRHITKNSLTIENGQYRIDFDDFEKKVSQDRVTMFILCNPHNPVGRVWTEEELRTIGELCHKHGVKIISDEIHADLIYKPHRHIPIASLSDELANQTITCLSPTKTFNLAGLQASYVITKNKEWRTRLEREFSRQGIYLLNTFGLVAMEAAYENGAEWLDELLATLTTNLDHVKRAFEHEPRVNVIEPEGTYLVWLDCRAMGLSNEELKEFMQTKAKVGLNDGISFGHEGEGFMRMNIAAPESLIKEGLNRILSALESKEKRS